jgi:hypothetical protein
VTQEDFGQHVKINSRGTFVHSLHKKTLA